MPTALHSLLRAAASRQCTRVAALRFGQGLALPRSPRRPVASVMAGLPRQADEDRA